MDLIIKRKGIKYNIEAIDIDLFKSDLKLVLDKIGRILKNNPNIDFKGILQKLNNYELFICITKLTMFEAGRSFYDSKENAILKLKNRKEAIELFSSPDVEYSII